MFLDKCDIPRLSQEDCSMLDSECMIAEIQGTIAFLKTNNTTIELQ